MHGSNPALRSSVIAGVRTAISTRKVTHYTVNHSIVFVDQRTDAHTNTIESTWPLQPAGGLHLAPCPLYVRDEVQGGESAPIHKIRAPRRHNRLELMSHRPFIIMRRVTSSWSADTFNYDLCSTASHTTGTCACARQQQAIRHRGNFRVFPRQQEITDLPWARMTSAPAAIFSHAPGEVSAWR
jgi:hypothetical protein